MACEIVKRYALMSALLMTAGCGGLGIQISGPGKAPGGHTVTFEVKLTNHSICPTDSSVVVVAFLTDAQITTEGNSEGEAVISLLCNGAFSLEGVQCSLAGDIITCIIPTGQATDLFAPLAQTEEFFFSPPGLAEPIACTQNGSVVQCRIPAADRQAFSYSKGQPDTAPLTSAASTPCIQVGTIPPELACSVPRLDAGAMTTFDVPVTSPGAPGTYRTLAFVEQTNGVCQGGPTPGQPCTDDTDCDTGGYCRLSICTSGTNVGEGCALDADCVGGGTGSCQECFDEGGTFPVATQVTPLACATTEVILAAAPASSWAGLLVASIVLLGVGACTLRRRQTSRNQ